MTKMPLRRRGVERARARIKQGTNRVRFSSIAEWDVTLFIHYLCQTTEAQNLNTIYTNLSHAPKLSDGEIWRPTYE